MCLLKSQEQIFYSCFLHCLPKLAQQFVLRCESSMPNDIPVHNCHTAANTRAPMGQSNSVYLHCQVSVSVVYFTWHHTSALWDWNVDMHSHCTLCLETKYLKILNAEHMPILQIVQLILIWGLNWLDIWVEHSWLHSFSTLNH